MDLNPQKEGMFVASTNLKTNLTNFQLKRNLLELEHQKKLFSLLMILKLFIN